MWEGDTEGNTCGAVRNKTDGSAEKCCLHLEAQKVRTCTAKTIHHDVENLITNGIFVQINSTLLAPEEWTESFALSGHCSYAGAAQEQGHAKRHPVPARPEGLQRGERSGAEYDGARLGVMGILLASELGRMGGKRALNHVQCGGRG